MSTFSGTVTKNDLSGGFWELVCDNGERYQLQGGDSSLHIEGNKVSVTGTILHSHMGIGMVGSILKIDTWSAD